MREEKARVDQDECTGCMLCIDTCPDILEMEDYLAVSKVDEMPSGTEKSYRQAAEDCPVGVTIYE